jgi:hypothetical protein
MSGTARQVETDDGPGTLDARGRLHIETPDGGIIIRTNWRAPVEADDGKHTANLALKMSDAALAVLADDLLRGIQADDLSRREWLQGLADAVEMLGLRLKKSGASADDGAAPLEGMATYDHPLLLQAVIRFQADFVAEMLPADGPVKVRSDETEAPVGMDNQAEEMTEDDLAASLEKDLNHYLTVTATEYYPDTTRMSFRVGLFGGGFKKVYDCPLRKRPVSESIEINDLIVDHSATDIQNASLVGRVTHRIKMQNAMLRRMIKAGVYRDVELTEPTEQADALEQAERRAQGLTMFSQLAADHPHTIFECSTGLDPEVVGDGAGDGTYRPYKVTIEETSRTVLSIRRNWAEDDELKMPRREYVKYAYIDGLGFYPIGLFHILGNTVRALTAAFREFLDAGMFANFPGGLISDVGGRQITNEIRVAPGSLAPIQTGGKPISDVVMNLPYRSPDAAFMGFIQHLEDSGKALGGEVSAPLSEGRSNMPVGTMLAAIEQAVKPLKGVFKGLHRAQAEEFQLLRDRFKENPSALWRYNARPARGWQEPELVQALGNCNLVPMADPNTSSQVQRVAIAGALFELAQAAPMLFKLRDTALRLMRMIGVPDPEAILDDAAAIAQKQAAASQGKGGAAQDPGLNAAKAELAQAQATNARAQAAKAGAEVQQTGAEFSDKQADRQEKAAATVVDNQERAADRASHLAIATMRERTEAMKTGAGMVQAGVEHHADAAEAEQQRAHEAGLAGQQQQHEAGLAVHQAATAPVLAQGEKK